MTTPWGKIYWRAPVRRDAQLIPPGGLDTKQVFLASPYCSWNHFLLLDLDLRAKLTKKLSLPESLTGQSESLIHNEPVVQWYHRTFFSYSAYVILLRLQEITVGAQVPKTHPHTLWNSLPHPQLSDWEASKSPKNKVWGEEGLGFHCSSEKVICLA